MISKSLVNDFHQLRSDITFDSTFSFNFQVSSNESKNKTNTTNILPIPVVEDIIIDDTIKKKKKKKKKKSKSNIDSCNDMECTNIKVNNMDLNELIQKDIQIIQENKSIAIQDHIPDVLINEEDISKLHPINNICDQVKDKSKSKKKKKDQNKNQSKTIEEDDDYILNLAINENLRIYNDEIKLNQNDKYKFLTAKDSNLDIEEKNKLKFGQGKNLVLLGPTKVRDSSWLGQHSDLNIISNSSNATTTSTSTSTSNNTSIIDNTSKYAITSSPFSFGFNIQS